MNKYLLVVGWSALSTFFVVGMDTNQTNANRWSPVERTPEKAVVTASNCASESLVAFHLSVNKKEYQSVAQILLDKESYALIRQDSLAKKLRATLTQSRVVGFTVNENEAPLVSFNSIKAVAFDLAKRGNNENFSYVLADYGVGNQEWDDLLHYSNNNVLQIPLGIPIRYKLKFDNAVEKMNYEEVAGMLTAYPELVANYPLAHTLNCILENQIHEFDMEDCKAQFISPNSLMLTAKGLAQYRNNEKFLSNLPLSPH